MIPHALRRLGPIQQYVRREKIGGRPSRTTRAYRTESYGIVQVPTQPFGVSSSNEQQYIHMLLARPSAVTMLVPMTHTKRGLFTVAPAGLFFILFRIPRK